MSGIRIQIGADVGNVEKAIDQVSSSLSSIQPVAQSAGQALENSLGNSVQDATQKVEGLTTSLKEVSQAVPKTIKIDVQANAAPATKEISKLSPVAQKSQNALTGLSGVVRDLPFGFIAIQNNLPILFDQFGALSQTSGGLKNAFKGIGAALAGPAGFAFAVGAVISGITSLVQKYGSLSSAINEVFILQKSQKDLQNELSTAVGKTVGDTEAEINTMKNLVGILNSSQSTLNQRNGAYDELNQKYPGLLSNLDKEKVKTGQLSEALATRLAIFAKEIELSGKRSALEKLIAKEAEKSYTSIEKLANQGFLDGLVDNLQGVLVGFQSGTAGLQVFAQGLQNGAQSTKFYQNALSDVQGELSGVQGEINALIKAQKDKEKEDEKNAANEKKRLSEITNSRKKAATAFKKYLEEQSKIREARSLRVPFLVSFEISEISKQDIGALYKKKVIDAFKKQSEKANAIQVPLNLPKINTEEILKQLIEVQNATAERRKAILKEANLQAATELFKSTFFDPVQNLFSDLLSGADGAFKAFAKAVLQAINQIVAKIIATGIISLIANLISGGTAGLFAKVGADIIGSLGFKKESFGGRDTSVDFTNVAISIQGAINSIAQGFQGAINNIPTPNFGGVTAGGMQMSGAVNVVLRGQDLVGSLNRTNSQISRVG